MECYTSHVKMQLFKKGSSSSSPTEAIESLDNNTLIPRTLDNMTFLFTNSTFLQKVLMSFGYIVWGSLKKCLAPQKRSVSLSLRPTF